ncbi:MAG: HAMP domain-containing protein [Acidobacteriota bacterium]
MVALQSRDRALAPYRRIQYGLLILGLVGNVAGVGASAWLARTLTAPVARLTEGTRQVAAGNFDDTISVAGRDEFGALAQSFNQMTRGLRVRADMQKFMSQSTMEIIQAGPGTVSAGDRRRLTVFFSDIRGFTEFADQRPPEEVVHILTDGAGADAGVAIDCFGTGHPAAAAGARVRGQLRSGFDAPVSHRSRRMPNGSV